MSNAHLAPIFREAARRIAEGEKYYACAAIESQHELIAYYSRVEALTYFERLFKPEGLAALSPWFDGPRCETQSCRALALLFAANYCESEAEK